MLLREGMDVLVEVVRRGRVEYRRGTIKGVDGDGYVDVGDLPEEERWVLSKWRDEVYATEEVEERELEISEQDCMKIEEEMYSDIIEICRQPKNLRRSRRQRTRRGPSSPSNRRSYASPPTAEDAEPSAPKCTSTTVAVTMSCWGGPFSAASVGQARARRQPK